MSDDLKQMIQHAIRGDSGAISHLYERFADKIYRYVSYRVSSTPDAEDITAEVFVSMLNGLPKYRETGAPFEAWLYRIAAARVADFHRRNARRPQVELPETLRSDAPAPEAHLEDQQELQTLKTAIAQLGEEHRMVLILRFVERKSHQEVAEIIGKGVSAVRSIQHRALIELASLLGSDEKIRHYLRGRSS